MQTKFADRLDKVTWTHRHGIKIDHHKMARFFMHTGAVNAVLFTNLSLYAIDATVIQ